MRPRHSFLLRRSAVLLIASAWLVGCGAAVPVRDTAGPSRPAQAEEQECDVEEAAEVVGVSPDKELTPEAEKSLCGKAELLLAELEAIEEGEENPGTPGDPPEPKPNYYEEDEQGIFSEQEANEAPSNTYHYGNLWWGVVDDRNITVSAGWEIKNPANGIVFFSKCEIRLAACVKRTRSYRPPIPGPLRIISADNPKLEIKSDATGEAAVFDAEEQQWLKEVN